MSKKPLYILKLGGSVVTHKNRMGISIRGQLLRQIAKALKDISKNADFQLIIVHGAGAAGHQLAHKYKLSTGTGNDKAKWFGSFLSNLANQRMNIAIAEIFIQARLRVVSAHTNSLIIQKNQQLTTCYLQNIKEALTKNCIPLLYGEMVFDKTLGMSICSGDSIVPYLAKKLNAQKVFFASDVDGIFDKDPYLNKNARLIEKVFMGKVEKNFKLSGSHNMDVTGGFAGKIKKLKNLNNSNIKYVEIFNGLEKENYAKIFLNKEFPHSKIYL
jgi:isopentenyl phosphate kinase